MVTPVTPATVMTIAPHAPFIGGAGVKLVYIDPGIIAVSVKVIPLPARIAPLNGIIFSTIYFFPRPGG